MSAAPRVVGLGFCAYDHLFTVDRYPERGNKIPIRAERQQGGGQVATALVALARLGVPVRVIGRRGDDAEGEAIEAGLREAGVDLAGLATVSGARSQRAFIIVPADGGERTVFWRRDPALDLAPADLDPAWFPAEPHLLLLDGHELDACLAAAALSRERDGAVVLDAEYVAPRTAELVARVDHLVADERFTGRLLGRPPDAAALEALRRMGPERVVVTLGERGAVSWDGRRRLSVPAYDVPVVDTTGAGDVFHAGYCYGLLAGWDDARRLRFACAMAGLKCRAPGGREGIPDLAEVEALMAAGRTRPPGGGPA
ncbi:MAG: hypothetical protein JW819_14095 [Candidatus Krumholzibacteriota bacterium]|nr:hypothetical protein [Candidatus Krumholzibacteriota bacterium]